MHKAETADEALAMIEDAKRGWIEIALEQGIEIPESVKEDYSGKLNVRVPKSLHKNIEQSAARAGNRKDYQRVCAIIRIHITSSKWDILLKYENALSLVENYAIILANKIEGKLLQINMLVFSVFIVIKIKNQSPSRTNLKRNLWLPARALSPQGVSGNGCAFTF